LIVRDTSNSLNSNTYLGSNTFSTVTLQGFNNASVFGIKAGTAITVLPNKNGTSESVNIYTDATSAATVTINDTFVGDATATGGRANFYHGNQGTGISDAKTINATLNLTDANVMKNSWDWIEQTIDAGNTGNTNAVITTTTNVSNATSDSSTNVSGAYVYIDRAVGSTVTSFINVTNSANVDTWVEANDNDAAVDSAIDTAIVVINGLTNPYYSEVGGYDFEKVNITINGAASLDDLSFYNSNDASTSQTVTIVANANLTVDSSDYNDVGSVALKVSGSGNVDLGVYYGTGSILSSTVSDTLDASALTGSFKVTIDNPINVIKGSSTGVNTIRLDDFSTFGSTIKGGLVVTGGSSTKDTLAISGSSLTAFVAGSADDRAKISGFENLVITDALGHLSTFDISKLSGITDFDALNGIVNKGTATVSGLGANANVILEGNLQLNQNDGALTLQMKTDTVSDTVNLTIKSDYTEDNNSTAAPTAITSVITATGIENLNIKSIGNASTAFLAATGNKADYVTNTLSLVDNDVVRLVVTGNQAFKFATSVTQKALTSIDASANTAGANIDANLTETTLNGAAALTIKGSATESNSIRGSVNNDTIIGGAKADQITGGIGGDTLTGNGGNDTFYYNASNESVIGTGTFDTITDFVANTYGNGLSGAAGTGADMTKLTGDVLSILPKIGNTGANGFVVYNATSASDATTFIANHNTANTIYAALDTTTGNVYIDTYSAGTTADMYIHLTGVTSLTAAAFTLAL
jgi:S-layer protein